ncbi:MAG: aspartate/tyrosine/aromatic aminotransferase, partial [Gammaproteobacteria bacterium]|nr:aspartate/tyrosine/aromatic aminotransferase [Gammaproteobacteria bacterium]
MFESLELLPPDAIIGLITECRNDPRDPKVDLGIGVYRNAAGETPVLDVVKRAEQRLIDTQASKAYIGSAGPADFNEAMRDLTFAGTVANDRVAMLQTPGGSGSLRVAAGVILRAREDTTVWVSSPTWANHVPLLGGAGLNLKPYAYYDETTKALDLDGMLDSLRGIPKGDIVLLHTCCHNPTGIDPDEAQWRAIADVIVERELLPFVDIAYQGFATDLDADAFLIRELAGRVPEMLVANSCSKNFGLYRDRVGALFVVTADSNARDVVQSQANNVVRTIYSMPPDHGAAVVAMILDDDKLRADWIEELTEMRERLCEMRQLLHDALREEAPDHDFSHLVRAKGMFCFLGVWPEPV